MKRQVLCASAFLASALISASVQAAETDYPSVAIADYVFGCMAANGQSRAVLEQCACSIDVISTIVPYDVYVRADTSMSLKQIQGDKAQLFKTSPTSRDAILEVRRAQAEAEMRCFEPHLEAGYTESPSFAVTPGAPQSQGDVLSDHLDPAGPGFQRAE